MNLMITVILAVHLMSALAMIGLILVQQGKGADMGAAFGGAQMFEQFLAPARADGDADQLFEIRRDRRTELIGAGVGDCLDIVDFHIEIDSQTQPHIVDGFASLAGAPGIACGG